MSRFSAELAWDAGAADPSLGRSRKPSLRVPGVDLHVEILDVEGTAAHLSAWKELCLRALEPNVFVEPGFALAAARHFVPANRPSFLLVWGSGADGEARLLGLCPIQQGRSRLDAAVVTVWTHEQATLSAPLLDRDKAASVLDAMLVRLARDKPDCAGLLLSGVALDGPTAHLLQRAPLRPAVLAPRTRAVLTPAAGRDALPVALPAKQAKELRRQQRRLAEHGQLEFRSAQSVDEIRIAMEQFLELEARGWKGDRRTALLHDPSLAAFSRAMTRLLARDGQCRIDSLDLDGKPVAMGIVLRSGDRAFFWKTAYDETLKGLSPGKQFASRLTLRQHRDRDITLTDSCAVPDHPMIDRLWAERISVADLVIPLPGAAQPKFDRAVRHIEMRARWRKAAKSGLSSMRRLLSRLRTRS